MASSSISRLSHYGAINPSILGDFDSPVGENPRASQEDETTLRSRPQVHSPTRSSQAFHYRPTTASILHGFGDSDEEQIDAAASADVWPAPRPSRSDDATAVVSSANQYGVTSDSILSDIATEESPAEASVATTSHASLLEPDRSPNNPYQSVLESRMNAMTVAFLRSSESITPAADLPIYPADEFGYVLCVSDHGCEPVHAPEPPLTTSRGSDKRTNNRREPLPWSCQSSGSLLRF